VDVRLDAVQSSRVVQFMYRFTGCEGSVRPNSRTLIVDCRANCKMCFRVFFASASGGLASNWESDGEFFLVVSDLGKFHVSWGMNEGKE